MALLLCCVDRNRRSSKSADGHKEAGCTSALLMLTLFGSVTAVLLSALLILIFTRQSGSKGQRQQQRDDGNSEWTEQNKVQDGVMMNYTALHFNKTNRRSERRVQSVDMDVGYSSVKK
ncbi:hypothetical protein AOLI_G00274710 [Acnodon oligacanthus]